MRHAYLIAAFAVFAPTLGAAVSMDVAPLVVELGKGAPSAVVTVRNAGAAPIRCQVSSMDWSESAAGEVQLTPSQELSAFPPLFQLKPGEERKIRVGATVPPAQVERTWRLFIEEVPSAVDTPQDKSTVRFRTRLAIPVFLRPANPAPRATLTLERAAGKLRLLVQNDGNLHFRPDLITLTMTGADGKPLFESEISTWTVLAGMRRSAEVPLPRERCEAVRSASVVAVTREGPVQATLALPEGVCAH